MTDYVTRLNLFLNRQGYDDDAIRAGLRFRTTGMEKIAKRLGVDAATAAGVLDQLTKELKREANRLQETYYRELYETSRYGYEEDINGNVTIRDGKTGEARFLRGTDASKLLRAVEADDPQHIIAQYFLDLVGEGVDESVGEVDDGDDYIEEIKNDRGSYNFPWKLDGQNGFGVAEYSGRGDTFKVEIVSLTDAEGDDVELDEPSMTKIKQQAFKFIGDA